MTKAPPMGECRLVGGWGGVECLWSLTDGRGRVFRIPAKVTEQPHHFSLPPQPASFWKHHRLTPEWRGMVEGLGGETEEPTRPTLLTSGDQFKDRRGDDFILNKFESFDFIRVNQVKLPVFNHLWSQE